MERVVVELISQTKDSTLSMLKYKDFECFVIEDGYRDIKEPGETRIPQLASTIKARRHGGFYVRYKTKYDHDFSLEIADVPGFSDILLHIGNTPKDTRGCLLLNYGCRKTDNGWIGIDSANAYKDFYDTIAPALRNGYEVSILVMR